jgi:hypothetical protein
MRWTNDGWHRERMGAERRRGRAPIPTVRRGLSAMHNPTSLPGFRRTAATYRRGPVPLFLRRPIQARRNQRRSLIPYSCLAALSSRSSWRRWHRMPQVHQWRSRCGGVPRVARPAFASMRANRARLSTRSQVRVVEDSGHFIHQGPTPSRHRRCRRTGGAGATRSRLGALPGEQTAVAAICLASGRAAICLASGREQMDPHDRRCPACGSSWASAIR